MPTPPLTASPPDMAAIDSDLSWDEAVRKGEDLAKRFYQTESVAPSLWQRFDGLAANGWTTAAENEGTVKAYNLPSEKSSLKALYRDHKLSSHPEQNSLIMLQHTKNSCVSWIDRPKTGAWYRCIYNPKVITNLSLASPKHAGHDHGIRASELPPLGHWSDVVFLYYQQYCRYMKTRPGGLRFIIQADIENATTIRIINEAFARYGRKTFERQTEAGKECLDDTTTTYHCSHKAYLALLGTPLGVGPAMFLLQHQPTLGRLAIEKVSCFLQSSGQGQGLKYTYNLVFHIEPVLRYPPVGQHPPAQPSAS